MSNRLLHEGRVPLVPDPGMAIQTSSAFAASQEQTDQVRALGRAFRALPKDILSAINGIAQLMHDAIRIRNISTMSDRELADIGLRRDQISTLFVDRRRDQMDVAATRGTFGDQ